MGTETIDEVVEENTNTFSKFDLNDYTEVVYEGKSGHGDSKIIMSALKDAVKKGLIDVKETKSGWIVKSLKDSNLMETIHRGERAFHYLRRFLQKVENS
jgi:hypothetical protein